MDQFDEVDIASVGFDVCSGRILHQSQQHIAEDVFSLTCFPTCHTQRISEKYRTSGQWRYDLITKMVIKQRSERLKHFYHISDPIIS